MVSNKPEVAGVQEEEDGEMESYSAGVLRYWSIGVLEYWSVGVLEVGQSKAIIAWRQTDHRTRKPHHSITPSLHHSSSPATPVF
jgi:hypothetical protein